ncbi:MAG TPA: hypothetical protein VNZ66_05605 [Aeromicrobium sp.]|nr:hypothetical protein [Aeromicrobium sp.]
MSATTSHAAAPTRGSGIPFGRHVRVELRKMIDTRAGAWLLGITAGLVVLAAAIALIVVMFDDNARLTADALSQIMAGMLSVLLPVIAITAVTGEWGQRTVLTTFALEPHRGRVIGAKYVSVLILALATIVLAVVIGVVCNVLGAAIGGYDVAWNIDVSDLLWTIGMQLAYFTMAFCLGLLFLSTPVAVSVFYVVALLLPFMVYGILYFAFGWARDLIPWLDMQYASVPLITGRDMNDNPVDVSALEWIRFVFTLFLWIVLPGGIGLRRALTTEVK